MNEIKIAMKYDALKIAESLGHSDVQSLLYSADRIYEWLLKEQEEK